MATDSVQTLLTKIDNRELVLPEFQREFTWTRAQSRDLIDSLLKKYPIGSLLFWTTEHVPALKNMPDFVPNGRVEVLLDGQQRLTALYLLTRNKIPPYYTKSDIEDGKDPRELYYNLETRDLRYYRRIEMENNLRWVPVTQCFDRADEVDRRAIAESVAEDSEAKFDLYDLFSRNYEGLKKIIELRPPIMHVEEDADLRHALTVFDRVNSNGTPLSEADIALAHMCSAWPDTRRVFKQKLIDLQEAGFDFDLTFLIRAMNAVANGRAEYRVLHNTGEEELRAAWQTLSHLLDYLVNFLRDRAYIHSTDDLNTSNVLIPIIAYLAQNGLKFQSENDRRKLLYWMYGALYKTRYSGSVDQKLESDLNALANDQPIESLISVLKEDHGDPKVSPDDFDSRGVQHPFYNMSVILIRANDGVDWSNGLAMNKPIGEKFSIERHHVFPKSVLEKGGWNSSRNLIHRKRVNEIANRVPLTRAANMDIFYTKPSDYLRTVEDANPGNLKRFMIPTDTELWKLENYEEFLEQRRRLMAEALNEFMKALKKAPTIGEPVSGPGVREIIARGENEKTEFKSTLRWHLYANRFDKEIEFGVLKTIAAFLNSEGGTLLVGVKDDGSVHGLEKDNFDSDDNLMLHLTNRVRDWIGASFMRFVRQEVQEIDGRRILLVRCQPSVTPAYLNTGKEEHFFVRAGPSTQSLPASEIHDYVQGRFF
ncbi:MAG: GmrSD restriction endonuclease domain-containing protein [Chloroflexota bacterium]